MRSLVALTILVGVCLLLSSSSTPFTVDAARKKKGKKKTTSIKGGRKGPAVSSDVEDASTMTLTPFSDDRHCPACCLLAASLHKQMWLSQPGAAYKGRDRKEYLMREDRVDDVLTKGLKSAKEDWLWINLGKDSKSGKPETKGYWPYDDLKARKMLSEDTIRQIEAQHRMGGDAAFNNFIAGEVLDEEVQDELEDEIKSNIYIDVGYGQPMKDDDESFETLTAKLCAKKFCPNPIPFENYPLNPANFEASKGAKADPVTIPEDEEIVSGAGATAAATKPDL